MVQLSLWVFLASVAGAAFQELLHWIELHKKLTRREWNAVVARPSSYVLSALFVLGTGAVALFWFAGSADDGNTLRNALIFGAGSPALLKKAVGAARPPLTLGGTGDATNARGYLS